MGSRNQNLPTESRSVWVRAPLTTGPLPLIVGDLSGTGFGFGVLLTETEVDCSQLWQSFALVISEISVTPVILVGHAPRIALRASAIILFSICSGIGRLRLSDDVVR